MSGLAPLVSRHVELELVASELARLQPGGVVLRGAAGVGKSRLADECAERARRDGCSVVAVRATETSRNVPFGALAALLPALGDETNPLAAATGPILDRRRRGSRLVMVVDDAQWLDETSAALILHLVTNHDVFALLTLRSGERSADAVRALWRDPLLRLVNVGPLADDEIVALAGGVLDSRLDANLAAEVAALAAGNPLAVVELLHGGRDDGLLANNEGVWTAIGDLTQSVAVHDLVARRIDRLDDPDRDVIELVAFGEPLAIDALTPDELDRLDDLESRALVSVRATTPRPEVWVAHPLHGQAIRRDASALRRRAVLRDLVGRVAGLHQEVDLLRVALWSLESGAVLSADHLSAAATRAFATHRYDLAARLIGAVPPGQRTDQQAYGLVVATWWTGDREAHHAAIAAARALALSAGLDDLARKLDEFERLTEPLIIRSSAEDAVTAEPGQLGRGVNSVALVPPAELAEAISSSCEIAEGTVGARQSRQFASLGLALNYAGRPLDALEHLEPALAYQIGVWDSDPMLLAPTHPVATLMATVLARVMSGDVAGGRQLAQRTSEFDFGADIAVLDAYGAFARGLVAHRAGELRRAQQHFTHAATRYDRSFHRYGPVSMLAHSMAAIVASQRRDVVAARRHLPSEGRATETLLGGIAGVAAGWVAAAERDLAGAARHFGAALDRNLAAGHRYFALEAASGLARIGSAEIASDRVAEFDEVQGRWLIGLRDAVVATAGRDAGRLEALSADFERMGALVDAAETAAERVRCLARSRLDRDATAAAVRLRELLARCEGLDTPGVVVPIEPVALTEREREVALLAADRVPAKEIAERLFISRRTVTNHLQRAYEKLGVSSRSELRVALGIGAAV